MLYICEFEFYDSGGSVIAEPLTFNGEGTFGDDLDDAVESAADWLSMVIDDHLERGAEMPPMSFGHKPSHCGRVIAVAVSRDLSDIPAMTAADAARELGVSTARVAQLVKAGLLDSWRDGTKRMVSRDSVLARKADAPKPGRPREAALA